jgi:hypothetical protein
MKMTASTPGIVEIFREELTRTLGLEQLIGEDVAQAAADDPIYAHHLRVCRNAPNLLRSLLANPPRIQEPTVASDLELMGKAAKALWNWRKAGFGKVDAQTRERRWNACTTCPHLVKAPDRALYRLTAPQDGDDRVCNLCGCVASRKVQLPTESCPSAHPQNAALTRWSEPALSRS